VREGGKETNNILYPVFRPKGRKAAGGKRTRKKEEKWLHNQHLMHQFENSKKRAYEGEWKRRRKKGRGVNC